MSSPVSSYFSARSDWSDVEMMDTSEITSTVAESSTATIAEGAGATVAEAEAAGAAAAEDVAEGASCCASIAGALEAAAAVVAIITAIVATLYELLKGEHVAIAIENKTPFPIKILDRHIHHGKCTGDITDGYIGATTPEMAKDGKSAQATLIFSKCDPGFFGTEGALLMEFRSPSETDPNAVASAAPLDWKRFSIGWYVPETGHNSVSTGAYYDTAHDAWKAIVDKSSKDQRLVKTLLPDADAAGKTVRTFKIVSALDHDSGGDIGVAVQISVDA